MKAETKETVLVVEDHENNRLTAEAILSNAGYEVLLAENSKEGLRLAQSRKPDMILLDVMMPEMNGFQTCQKLREDDQTKDIPIFFVTARVQPNDRIKGLNLGADDYITKPYDADELLKRIENRLKKHQEQLLLEKKVRQRTKELEASRHDLIKRLALAGEYKDNETGRHNTRMSQFCTLLAKTLGMTESQCQLILVASPLHDVGKIGIPDNVLLKPGKLDPDEWKVMQTHTTIGGDLLLNNGHEPLRTARLIALTHHERWDGTGYPEGLMGEETPIVGRIVTIADVFDALTSKRPYKKAWNAQDALNEIKKGKGTCFDPCLVDAFEGVFSQILKIKSRFAE